MKLQVGETLLKILVHEPAFPSVTIGDSENAESPNSDQILANESAFATMASGDSDNAKSLDSNPAKGKRVEILSTPAVRSLANIALIQDQILHLLQVLLIL